MTEQTLRPTRQPSPSDSDDRSDSEEKRARAEYARLSENGTAPPAVIGQRIRAELDHAKQHLFDQFRAGEATRSTVQEIGEALISIELDLAAGLERGEFNADHDPSFAEAATGTIHTLCAVRDDVGTDPRPLDEIDRELASESMSNTELMTLVGAKFGEMIDRLDARVEAMASRYAPARASLAVPESCQWPPVKLHAISQEERSEQLRDAAVRIERLIAIERRKVKDLSDLLRRVNRVLEDPAALDDPRFSRGLARGYVILGIDYWAHGISYKAREAGEIAEKAEVAIGLIFDEYVCASGGTLGKDAKLRPRDEVRDEIKECGLNPESLPLPDLHQSVVHAASVVDAAKLDNLAELEAIDVELAAMEARVSRRGKRSADEMQ